MHFRKEHTVEKPKIAVNVDKLLIRQVVLLSNLFPGALDDIVFGPIREKVAVGYYSRTPVPTSY